MGAARKIDGEPHDELRLYDPDRDLEQKYDHWLKKTGSAEAAATLTLAHVQYKRHRGPKSAQPNTSAAGGLLDLSAAAEYLGYNPAGLRKIVQQKRIRYVQNGRGPIRFRQEWLDEFIAANSSGPEHIERAPAQKRSKPRPQSPSTVGFDSSHYLR